SPDSSTCRPFLPTQAPSRQPLSPITHDRSHQHGPTLAVPSHLLAYQASTPQALTRRPSPMPTHDGPTLANSSSLDSSS
ncbi:unnamed protein product, partial [Dovyalis caffra]